MSCASSSQGRNRVWWSEGNNAGKGRTNERCSKTWPPHLSCLLRLGIGVPRLELIWGRSRINSPLTPLTFSDACQSTLVCCKSVRHELALNNDKVLILALALAARSPSANTTAVCCDSLDVGGGRLDSLRSPSSPYSFASLNLTMLWRASTPPLGNVY